MSIVDFAAVSVNCLLIRNKANFHMNSRGEGRQNEQQSLYIRQATILRKNMIEWDHMLRNAQGEDWPKMLGRLNAAFHQTSNMDKSIDDVMEHFVYVPKQSTANPQDVPFFLSTRLEAPAEDVKGSATSTSTEKERKLAPGVDPVKHLADFESMAAKLAIEYEDTMERY